MRAAPTKYISFPIFMLVLFAFAWIKPAGAQNLSQKEPGFWNSNWNITLNGGGTQFFGDVNNRSYLQKWTSKESPLGFQLGLTKMLQPSWGVGLNLNYTGVKSVLDQLPDGTNVDFSLSGIYYSVGPYLYLNFNNLIFGYKADRFWSLYGRIGVGYAMWNTELTNNITGTVVKSGSTVGSYTYANKAFEVPLSAGIRFRINARWSIDAGAVFTTVLSDDVDLWHEGYKYDRFTYTHVGITFAIGKTRPKSSSPEIVTPTSGSNRVVYRDKKEIPIYDYTFYASPEKSLQENQKTQSTKPVDLLQIDNPVSPPVTKQQKSNTSKKPVVMHQGLEFRVQIMAADKKIMSAAAMQSKYHLSYPVEEVYQDGYFRYTVGHFNSYQAALSESRRIRANGIHDAFVTAYRNGKRVPLTKAMMR